MIRSVLLVDYDPRSVKRLRDLLQQDGMQTLLATNGNAGVDACRLCRPDLVVVQDLVPGRHGFEVCGAIKSGSNGDAPPVLLLFSPRPGRRSAARSCGCDAVLDKPFDDAAFRSTVRGLLPSNEVEIAPPGPLAGQATDPEIELILEHLFPDATADEPAAKAPATKQPAKALRSASPVKRPRRSKRRGKKAASKASPAEPGP